MPSIQQSALCGNLFSPAGPRLPALIPIVFADKAASTFCRLLPGGVRARNIRGNCDLVRVRETNINLNGFRTSFG